MKSFKSSPSNILISYLSTVDWHLRMNVGVTSKSNLRASHKFDVGAEEYRDSHRILSWRKLKYFLAYIRRGQNMDSILDTDTCGKRTQTLPPKCPQ